MAQRYMQVAEGLKLKAKDRPELDALLASVATQMTEEGRARLAAAVENICDGETMASLIEAYRITKRAPGTAATGGYKVDEERVQVFLRGYHPQLEGTRYAELPEDVQAEFRRWFANGDQNQMQLALDYWQPLFTRFESNDARQTFAELPESEKVRAVASAKRIIAWYEGQN